ncbi:MAG: hypothetical protein CVT84_11820 [Alphaproteobacteria bacterium HGW-Alphaproteobacteria-6]|nr:MAG: hypothetical protein CVT84_11820 [Alphaproteobacteria bacterium HGW-Alphaproteobacteria-6]
MRLRSIRLRPWLAALRQPAGAAPQGAAPHRRPSSRAIASAAAFVLAAGLGLLAAIWAVRAVESQSIAAVGATLSASGHDWAGVAGDGLLITLSGTAPTEAARFRALTLAGAEVGAGRLIDAMAVADPADLAPPDFSIEILRNDDGISLIGLVPEGPAREALITDLGGLAGQGGVTDMMEAADYPVPPGWDRAVGFGIAALQSLPRSKISIAADRVAITAITDSAAEKARIETDLARRAPKGLVLKLDISAPRPVIAPFTLRFLVDESGARFDACSAESEASRDRILSAAAQAGVTRKTLCTIGLGVPTPDWSAAVAMGLAALHDLGAGSITFSDADISLIADDSVAQADFDRVVGEMESNLPAVFALRAVLTPKPDSADAVTAAPEFTASLSATGQVALRGRIGDALSRDAVANFARARFGTAQVHAATRLDPEMPRGWSLAVLAALEALGELHHGEASVTPGLIRISGTSDSPGAAANVARLLSDKLGDSRDYQLDIRYDEALDPLLGLPTPAECVARINAALVQDKITFDPGSANIATAAAGTLDRIAALMKDCTDVAMEVGGHTDSQGREEMNLALSEDRASAVIAALMARRILTGSLLARGYGETLPVADNETEAGREANRRIEFRLVGPDAGDSAANDDAAIDDAAGDDAAGEGEAIGGTSAAADGSDGATPEPSVAAAPPTPDTPRPKPRPEGAAGAGQP